MSTTRYSIKNRPLDYYIIVENKSLSDCNDCHIMF